MHISNGRYFVEWACGADLSADTIEARWNEIPSDTLFEEHHAEFHTELTTASVSRNCCQRSRKIMQPIVAMS